MASDRRPYVAVLLFETTTREPGPTHLYSEDISLIFAGSLTAARSEAERHARAQETTYQNATGHEVTVRFLQTVDVAEALHDDLSRTTDLYSRHFRDLDRYRSWEPLLDGEPL